MTPQMYDWARRWHVSTEALQDLARAVGMYDAPTPIDGHGTSEAARQTLVRLEASRRGARLWRNNVGDCAASDGRHIRYGLANESPAMNRRIKSSDLVGIQPVTVTPAHVGTVIGQFVAREVKRAGWKYRAVPRERAQLQFLTVVNALGGDGMFTTGTF